MSILYSGDLVEVPPEAQRSFAEFFFAQFQKDPDHILLVS